MLAASFSDSGSDTVGFESSWRSSVVVSDADAQTDPLEVVHQRTQHPKTKASCLCGKISRPVHMFRRRNQA